MDALAKPMAQISDACDPRAPSSRLHARAGRGERLPPGGARARRDAGRAAADRDAADGARSTRATRAGRHGGQDAQAVPSVADGRRGRRAGARAREHAARRSRTTRSGDDARRRRSRSRPPRVGSSPRSTPLGPLARHWTVDYAPLLTAVDRGSNARHRRGARRRRRPPSRRTATSTVSRATVVTDAAILVFREGLEAVLILAAITASFVGARRTLRRPVLLGGLRRRSARPRSRGSIAQLLIDQLGTGGLRLEAITGVRRDRRAARGHQLVLPPRLLEPVDRALQPRAASRWRSSASPARRSAWRSSACTIGRTARASRRVLFVQNLQVVGGHARVRARLRASGSPRRWPSASSPSRCSASCRTSKMLIAHRRADRARARGDGRQRPPHVLPGPRLAAVDADRVRLPLWANRWLGLFGDAAEGARAASWARVLAVVGSYVVAREVQVRAPRLARGDAARAAPPRARRSSAAAGARRASRRARPRRRRAATRRCRRRSPRPGGSAGRPPARARCRSATCPSKRSGSHSGSSVHGSTSASSSASSGIQRSSASPAARAAARPSSSARSAPVPLNAPATRCSARSSRNAARSRASMICTRALRVGPARARRRPGRSAAPTTAAGRRCRAGRRSARRARSAHGRAAPLDRALGGAPSAGRSPRPSCHVGESSSTGSSRPVRIDVAGRDEDVVADVERRRGGDVRRVVAGGVDRRRPTSRPRSGVTSARSPWTCSTPRGTGPRRAGRA